MDRTPEPELMDDPAQALAYARADFDQPHSELIRLYSQRIDALGGLPSQAYIADLGCGPGDITLRLARTFPQAHIDGYDGAMPMIHLARAALIEASDPSLWQRIRYHHRRLPDPQLPRHHYHLVVSNSLLHHLADPMTLWHSARAIARPGTILLVSDLLRPESPEAARALVEAHADNEPEVLKQDFYHSLLAAYRLDEVQEQLAHAGLDHLDCRIVSDRHWLISGRLPT